MYKKLCWFETISSSSIGDTWKNWKYTLEVEILWHVHRLEVIQIQWVTSLYDFIYMKHWEQENHRGEKIDGSLTVAVWEGNWVQLLMRMGLLSGMSKHSKFRWYWWLHNFVIIRKSTRLCTLEGWTLWYVNYISIKLLQDVECLNIAIVLTQHLRDNL